MPVHGYSASLVYKDWGANEANLIIGGAFDIYAGSDQKKWRTGIVRITEDGANPPTGSPMTHFDQVDGSTGDISSNGPYIDHLHLDDQSVAGEEWLFGTTKSYDPAQSGTELYIFKVRLDATLHQPTDGLVLKKVNGVASPGHVIAVKPTMVAGEIHFVSNDSSGNIWYFTWDFAASTADGVQLYSDTSVSSMGAFVGTKSEIDQGKQIYQGYIGTTLRQRTDQSFVPHDATFETPSVLSLMRSESCLLKPNQTETLTINATPQTMATKEGDWLTYSLNTGTEQNRFGQTVIKDV